MASNELPGMISGADRGIEDAAEVAQRRLREAIDVLPQGIVFLDPDGRYILWNQQYSEIYARSADLLEEGVRLADTLRVGVERGDYPEALRREEEWLTERLSLMQNPGTRHEQRLANGRVIMIEERKTQDGGTIGLRVDITELKQKEESFRLLFQGNPVPLFVIDPASGTIREANEAALVHFGYARKAIVGQHADVLFEEDEQAEARAMLARDCSEKDRFWRQRAQDGTRLESVLFTRRSVHEGLPATIVSVFDVTERRAIEARMAHMARHDELTGLVNRAYCRESLHDLLGGDGRCDVKIALIDLDHFKAVNDTYGHLVGDMLLENAARRMRQVLPPGTILGRIGGDEFAAIFREMSDDQVDALGRSVIATLSEPFFIGDAKLHIGATIGTASALRDTSDAETLLRYADLALYAAKGRKRGSLRRFELAMDAAAQRKSRLEGDLREALAQGRLELHYQPLINLGSGAVECYEALLRWQHPEFGAISPETFIPLAEEMGLIDQLGQFVLNTACAEAATWPEAIKLSVNVSPVQFRNGQLLSVVVQALGRSGLAPTRLELEITEAVLMDKGSMTLSIVGELRALGIGLSMDDFGTGYSSLSYLLNYPFTKIKIDKSFILGMERAGNSQAVIRAVIGLGRSLGMTVTAEGIEHPEIADYLRAEGCTQGQGYLFGKAMAAGELGIRAERAA